MSSQDPESETKTPGLTSFDSATDDPATKPDSWLSRKQQRAAWERILQISEQLTQLAHQKDWDALTRQHQLRDELLEAFFAHPVDEELTEQVRQGISHIVRLDSEIIQWVQNNRDQLGEEAQRLRSLRQRAAGYTER